MSVFDHCLRSRHYVNVVVAGKHALPQWLTMDAAVVHCTEGIGIWQWASNDQNAEPDVVMGCCGDTPTLEILAAVSILGQHLPDLKLRVVNVVDLMKLQSSSEHPHRLPSALCGSVPIGKRFRVPMFARRLDGDNHMYSRRAPGQLESFLPTTLCEECRTSAGNKPKRT